MFDAGLSLATFVQLLSRSPHWGSVITYVISFLESLAIVGSIIPGSLTMTAIGMLIGTHVLPPFLTWFWAVLGAISGDYVSYWIGMRYQTQLFDWPFIRHRPHWIEKASYFFKHHGVKSIIIGRFFGPMRSMIPLIAGIVNMPAIQFIPAVLVSAILWAFAYLLPGVLLGALSLQLPPSAATKFVLFVLGVSALIWLVIWIIQHSFMWVKRRFIDYTYRLWLAVHCRFPAPFVYRWLPLPQQMRRLIIALILSLLFLLLALVLSCTQTPHHFIWTVNTIFFSFMRSIHTDAGTVLATYLTLIANRYVIMLGAIITLILWGYQAQWHAAGDFLKLLLATVICSQLVKLCLHIPRPSHHFFTNPGFPSGHTAIFTAYTGFWASIIWPHLTRPYMRYTVATCISLFVFCIGGSRLYLGVHWLSDVLGGGLLALGLIVWAQLFRHRKMTRSGTLLLFNTMSTPHKKWAYLYLFAPPIGLLVAWMAFSQLCFPFYYQHYRPHWPVLHTQTTKWWTTRTSLPLYLYTYTTHASAPLNIQWQGTLPDITKTLIENGWVLRPNHMGLARITEKIQYATLPSTDTHFPSLPPLPLFSVRFENRTPALVATYQPTQDTQKAPSLITTVTSLPYPLVLRIWHAPVHFTDHASPLWLGSLTYLLPPKKHFSPVVGRRAPLSSPHPRNHTLPDRILLHRYLQNNATSPTIKWLYRDFTVPLSDRPIQLRTQHWDGSLLLIKK